MKAALPSANIDVGVHHTATILGAKLNVDTIWSTVLAGLIVVGCGYLVARRATSGVPGKVQLAWEMLVDWISELVQDNIGRPDRNVIQLAIMLFSLILVGNWLEIIPTNEYVPAPTSDLNLTLALGAVVIIGVHVRGIRAKGFGGYVKHYFEPYPILFPLKLIEEIVKPFTLALRLFGNIFAGGLMLSIIGLLPLVVNWIPQAAWKLFDMGIGAIQAVIFSLLTIIYYAEASETHADEDAHLGDAQPDAGETDGAGRGGHASVTLPAKEPETAGAR